MVKNTIGSFKIAVQDNDFSLFEKELTNDLVRDELNNGIFDYGHPTAALRLSDIVFDLLYKGSSLVNTPGGDRVMALHFSIRPRSLISFWIAMPIWIHVSMITLRPQPRCGLTLPLMLRNYY